MADVIESGESARHLEAALEFNASTNLSPRQNVFASKLTTFRIGGAFQYFVEPNSINELNLVVAWCKHNKQNFRIIGAGSNLLVDSAGLPGWTIRLGREFKSLEKKTDNYFRVGAAYSLTNLARELSQSGLSGLEFAAGIPASIGGAVRMNAGAHGGEISTVISAVDAVSSDGIETRFESSELNFNYRHCSIPQDFIITSVEICLLSSERESVMKKLSLNLDYRKRTQPLSQPSAGSVFRNLGSSTELCAGAIIDSLALKGHQQGGAEISRLHANWIINPKKNANSSDVVALIELCKSEANSRRSQKLQTEIIMW